MLKFNINRFNNMGNIKRGRISDPLRYHIITYWFFSFLSERISSLLTHTHTTFVCRHGPLPLLLLPRFFHFTTCVQPPQRLLSPSLLYSLISTKSLLSKISNHSLHYIHTLSYSPSPSLWRHSIRLSSLLLLDTVLNIFVLS